MVTIHLLWVGDILTGAYSTHERVHAEAEALAANGHGDIYITDSPLDEDPVL